MKIVYCIHSLFNSGGMERVLTNKANFLVNNIDCEIKIVTTEQENKLPFYELDPKIEIINLDINYSKDNSKNVFSKIINTFVKFRIGIFRLDSYGADTMQLLKCGFM